MALKKYCSASKKRSGDSGVEADRSSLSKEQRDQRISLFLRDFDQHAKENLQAMKQDLEALLQTAEKAFRVELLTRPLVVRQMRRKELIHLKEEEAAATLVAAVTANDCSVGEGPNPKLVRTGSKRVKVTTIVEYEDEKEESGSKTKKTLHKTLCSANDDLQNINMDLLNDDTVQHIHTLVNQLTVLCGKATVKPS